MSCPYWKQGPLRQPATFFYKLTMKKHKKREYAWPIATIGRNTCPMTASSGFYQSPGPPPLGNARGIVPVHLRGHKNGQQVGAFFHCFFVCCPPGKRRGNTERAVAWWRHPMAFGVALDMPHQRMPSVLLQCTCMAIEMASDRGAFIFIRRLFCLT